MKYRILEDSPLFIPQYKRLFFWQDFFKIRKWMGFLYRSKEAFSSLEGARKFLDEEINKKSNKKQTKIYPH